MLTPSREPGRPFTDVALDAEITAPDGTQYLLPGFHDGGRVWRARFMPYEAGRYDTWFFDPRTGPTAGRRAAEVAAAGLALPARHDDLDWVFVAEPA